MMVAAELRQTDARDGPEGDAVALNNSKHIELPDNVTRSSPGTGRGRSASGRGSTSGRTKPGEMGPWTTSSTRLWRPARSHASSVRRRGRANQFIRADRTPRRCPSPRTAHARTVCRWTGPGSTRGGQRLRLFRATTVRRAVADASACATATRRLPYATTVPISGRIFARSGTPGSSSTNVTVDCSTLSRPSTSRSTSTPAASSRRGRARPTRPPT